MTTQTFEQLAAAFEAPKTYYAMPVSTRSDAIQWLLDQSRQRRRHYDGRTWSFCWNVKLHLFNADAVEGKPEYDARWKTYWSKNEERLYPDILDDARSNWSDEWSSYPGDDGGDWTFGYYGRSGGWLALEQWKDIFLCDGDLEDWLVGLDDADLFKFFVGIMWANHDFTPKKACEQMASFISKHRSDKEEEWAKDDKEAAEHRKKREDQIKVLDALVKDMKQADPHYWEPQDVVAMEDLLKEIGQ